MSFCKEESTPQQECFFCCTRAVVSARLCKCAQVYNPSPRIAVIKSGRNDKPSSGNGWETGDSFHKILVSMGDFDISLGLVPGTPSGMAMPSLRKCFFQYFGILPRLLRKFIGWFLNRWLPEASR